MSRQQLPSILSLPSEDLQGLDNPLIFSKREDDRNRPANGQYQSILPNNNGHQNKFVVFYEPKSSTNPLNNPVVGLYPLQREGVDGKEYEGFRAGKNGASVEEIVALTRFLCSKGPHKYKEIAKNQLMKACAELGAMQTTVSLREIFHRMSCAKNEILNFVELTKDEDGEITAIFLVMQWGPLSKDTSSFNGNGFLYQGLLMLSSVVVRNALNLLAGIKRKHRTNDTTHLAEASKYINGALEELRTRKQIHEMHEVNRIASSKIKPPMLHLDEDLYDVNVQVPVYPAEALDFMIKREVLSKDAPQGVRAYLFHRGTDKTKSLFVKVGLDARRPEQMDIYVHANPNNTRVDLGKAHFVNYATFLVRSGDSTIRQRWRITSVDDTSRKVIIPRKSGGKPLEVVAERKSKGLYAVDKLGLKLEITGDSHFSVHGEASDADLDLSKAIAVAGTLKVTLQDVSGKKVSLNAELNPIASVKSQVLKQYVQPVYLAEGELEGRHVKIDVLPTHYVEFNGNQESFKKLGLETPENYSLGSLKILIRDPIGDESVINLMGLYTDYRNNAEKSLNGVGGFRLIDKGGRE